MARKSSFWRSSITSSMSGEGRGPGLSPTSANGPQGQAVLHACLRAHPLDDPPERGGQLAAEAAGRLGHVAHQPARELDLVQDPQHREHRAQVGGHRLLEGEQLVDAVLDLELRDLAMAGGVDHAVGGGEVGVEEGVGAGCDRRRWP